MNEIRTQIARQIFAKRAEIETWIMSKYDQTPPPFYNSVDIRDSGLKIAPVDCNLYPAGFNNICPDDLGAAAPIFRRQIERVVKRLGRPMPQKLLIIPENHTQNRFYIENVEYLRDILINAGFDVGLGWLDLSLGANPPRRDAKDAILLQSNSGTDLVAEHVFRETSSEGARLRTASMVPDFIILNNDFSQGHPTILDDLEQPVFPSHRAGWHSRRKSRHFEFYNLVAGEFAQLIGFDPWFFQVDSSSVDHVNFDEPSTLEPVKEKVAATLERMFAKYREYGVAEKPSVFVKSNMGTYGMGIMVVQSPAELDELNRRTKNKMSVGKNKIEITSLLIQEGIPTRTRIEQSAAEPVIYSVGCELMGGFLRFNPERGDTDNLNSRGMVFKKICILDLQRILAPDDIQKQLIYGSVARLASLAAGMELAEK